MTEKEEDREKSYFYRDLGLLSSRLHFFLVAISFLILAFVTLVTSDLSPAVREPLGHAIAALASCLSMAFFLINYLAATMLKPPDGKETNPDKEDEPAERLRRFPIEMVGFVLNPLNYSVEKKACHTWAIPLTFYVFWGVAWGLSLSWIGPLWCFIGLLLAFLFWTFLSWTCTAKPGSRPRYWVICLCEGGGYVLGAFSTAILIASCTGLIKSLPLLLVLIPILGLAGSIVGLFDSRSVRAYGIASSALCLIATIALAIIHTTT
jgi:hypothetical protein